MQETIDRIITGAGEEFARLGYDAARVDSIARQCGVNKASLYYHFQDKATLYNVVVRHHLLKATRQIDANLTPEASPKEQLRNYLGALMHTFYESRFISPIMLREAVSGGRNLSRESLEVMRGILGRFRGVVEAGVQSGAFRSVDLPFIHMTVIGTANFLIGSAPLRERFVSEGLLSADELPGSDTEENARRLFDFVYSYLNPKENG
jgi:AcrR family transcriptional regulator